MRSVDAVERIMEAYERGGGGSAGENALLIRTTLRQYCTRREADVTELMHFVKRLGAYPSELQARAERHRDDPRLQEEILKDARRIEAAIAEARACAESCMRCENRVAAAG